MKKTLLQTTYFLTLLAGITCLSAYNSEDLDAKKIKRTTEQANLKLPTGFKATVVADDLVAARHLVVSKSGDIYVKLSKLKDGKGLYHLRDTNKDGFLDQQTGIGNYPGTGIALKNNYLYSASNTGVYRYQLNAKEEVMQPEQPEEIVKGLVAKTRDVSKSIAVDNKGNLYVTVGSPDETCRDDSGKGIMPCPLLDSVGGIWQFKTNKKNQSYSDAVHYATGLKNVVGLDWNTSTNSLFAMMHGRGQFHDKFPQYYTPEQSMQLPAETMFELKAPGADAGWPYVYYDHKQKKKMLTPEYGGDGKKTGGEKALDPVVAFPAHLGPNGLLFYTGTMFPARYKNGAFIAFHGKSTELQKGYMVAFVPFKNGKPSGDWEIFADNFAGVDLVQPTGPIQHRPCGLAQGPDGALYVSDDLKGTIYRITYAGKK
ncbi:PQQ-dependent sugar dehydrogenase [Adhaeribacter radiodurans]|uniref:PQQ-dependent sugar dehydrogenase n=1 Tax=Adhaeribacter radiodurans TaxID=2745197 RepID=A0A7L7LDI2_9BACT|nr:PQQ-dependent sugar dehydrogenase [Adhaeribacter radiodurans]QMU30880.1 PQQ-dependent sugar dehydrogenase [Adhaeribacter radiodurans]